MVNYYEKHYGDLYPGHIAKSSDINQIQQNIQDALKNAIRDLTEGESWILGTNDQTDKDSFILTPASKRGGRYIDQMNLAEGDDVEILSFREISYRQPIKLARSSVYSVIVKLQNKSEIPVPVVFELRDQDGDPIPNMRTTLTLPKNTNAPAEFEIVFDLNHYPTAHGIESEDLEDSSTDLIQKNTNEGSDEEGKDFTDETVLESSTTGASVVYLFIEALNKSKSSEINVNTIQKDGYEWNDSSDPTFGIVANKNSQYGQLLEESTGNEFTASSIPADLYFKEVYANSPTYICNFGQAVIGGEKVVLADTHISVGGASTLGNIVSYIYLDSDGHLQFENSDPFTGTELPVIQVSEEHLHIANIITYQNDSKDPIIYQSDEERLYRPRSHHERIRRLEKKLNYTQEIAIPARLKYTLTGEDWIDPNPNVDFTDRYYNPIAAQDLDNLNNKQYVLTTDENGNPIIKLSKAESFSIPITLKNKDSGKISTEKNKTKVISTAQTTKYIETINKSDKSRAQTFAEMKNLVNDFKKGTLSLSSTSEVSGSVVATTRREAEETEFNPWDDSAANRPKNADIKPNTRAYTVVKGKNAASDWASEFPAMTFFTNTGYTLKKLEIPIYKFKNCEGIKFYIYKRQGPNNKTNTVWLEKKIKETKVYSLKNAKIKKGYQYMENGFLIDFTSSTNKKGLELPKGQYVIICLPIPKSGKGTVYVDTYKPKNSKDFCIRYHGAGNASHFLLKDRYQEIWYNPVKAVKEDINYSKKGEVVSGVVSWENTESIKTVKPLMNAKTPKGTSIELYVDTGGGWVKVSENKSNNVVGSGTGESFRWKAVLKGNGKESPVISYDKNKKYALKFEITRSAPNLSNNNAQDSLESKNLAFTSKPFNANEILREYIGDMNLGLTDNKFSNFEFFRAWMKDGTEGESSDTNNSVLIDLSASDKIDPVLVKSGNSYIQQVDDNGKQLYYPLYSLHYVDLGLDDFSQTSVDYSNYDAFVEDDEYNLRLKLDTENSYNDNDIKIINPTDFKLTDDIYSGSNDSDEVCIDLTRIPESEVNQVLAKARFNNPLDLSKYAELRVKLDLEGTEGGTLSGLGVYISSAFEPEAPTMLPSEDLQSALVDELPDLNTSQENVINQYANQIIRKSYNENGVGFDVYYRSVWDSSQGIWKWEQLHDVKSYNIYELVKRGQEDKAITLEKSEETYSFFIKVDPDSINFQYVKEIGIISLKDNEKYSVENISKITLNEFDAIKNDYYPVFSAKNKDKFVKTSERSPVTCISSGNLNLGENHYKNTVPDTSVIEITHQSVLESGEDLCTFDLTSKDTTGFEHVGIQIASDCLLTKYMLELHLRKIDGGIEKTIEKIRLPTINHLYYPTTSNNNINLSQVFKKIKTSDRFDKIVLYATPRFKSYSKQLKTSTNNESLGNTITLYIGNISLYKAKTIPFLYQVMRAKFYLDDASETVKDQLAIRKIGTILNYR